MTVLCFHQQCCWRQETLSLNTVIIFSLNITYTLVQVRHEHTTKHTTLPEFFFLSYIFPTEWGRKQSLCEVMTWEVSPLDSFISSLNPGVHSCLRYTLHLKNNSLHCPKKWSRFTMTIQTNITAISGLQLVNQCFCLQKKQIDFLADLSESFFLVTSWKRKRDRKNGKSVEKSK